MYERTHERIHVGFTKGFYKFDYTPPHRGFDLFSGFYGSAIRKKNHKQRYVMASGDSIEGYDFRDNDAKLSVTDTYADEYWTQKAIEHIYAQDPNTPFFMYMSYSLPHSPVDPHSDFASIHASNPNWGRGQYLGMVSHLDDLMNR